MAEKMTAKEITKLVAALRYHADTTNCDACKLYDAGKCELKSCVLHDAAAAIEAMQAQMPKRGEWVVFNKQMLINLENAREQYKELGYPHRTELGLQCSNCRKVTYVDSGIKYEFCPHCGAKMEVQE